VIVPDVTVVINAARSGAPDHDLARRTLVDILTGTEPVGLLDETLTSVVRVLTNPRLGPSQPPGEAIAFCERVREAPSALRLTPSDTAWARFTTSVHDLDLRGNDVPDAWLAAVVSTSRATLMTFDRGFRRFPGLDVVVLGADT
jgi:toxin-antitoxin system PIN domain toxin